MSVGFGICTQNRKALLLQCLDAVWKFAPLGSEIVIGDDCSTDGSPDVVTDWIAERGIRNTHLIRSPEMAGISNNKRKIIERLLSYSVDDVILIEDDVIPLVPLWYDTFIQTAYRNQEAHLLYMPTERKYGITNHVTGVPEYPISWKVYCSGMIMYWRTSLLWEVGNFQPGFKRYGWDHNEMTARCLLAQYRDPGGPYPHCLAAERDKVVRAMDIEAANTGQNEDSTCGTVQEKMLLANQNKPLYEQLFGTYRVMYSGMELKSPEEKLKRRQKFFKVLANQLASV